MGETLLQGEKVRGRGDVGRETRFFMEGKGGGEGSGGTRRSGAVCEGEAAGGRESNTRESRMVGGEYKR